ncbi:hypothetical protein KIPB_008634, partial [Kipferlia bialata]
FESDPDAFVCPANAEGGYPMSWLQPQSVTDYPESQVSSLFFRTLRRLWLPPKELRNIWESPFLHYEGSADEYQYFERTLVVVYALLFVGPLMCAVFICLVFNIVWDQDGARKEGKRLARRAKQRAAGSVSEGKEAKWRRQDLKLAKKRRKWLSRDPTTQSYISIREVRKRLDRLDVSEGGVLQQQPSQSDSLGECDDHLDTLTRGDYVGGRLKTYCKWLVVPSLVAIFAAMCLFSLSPVLSESLHGTLSLYNTHDRVVESSSFSSISYDMQSEIDDWVNTNGNLYVVEMIGGSWGTECIDYTLFDGNDTLANIVQVVFGASAGLFPEGLQTSVPTTMDELYEDWAFTVSTQDCYLHGSHVPCEDSYGHVAAYGCYVDTTGVYHHLSLATTALLTGIPDGMEASFHMEWTPSERFPDFGLHPPAGLKLHVLPPPLSFMYQEERDGDTIPGSSGSRYAAENTIICSMLISLSAQESDDWFEHCEGEDGELFTSDLALCGNDGAGNSTWDDSRVVSKAIAPVPETQQESDTVTDYDYSCVLECEETDWCVYTGEYCKDLQRGITLNPSSGHPVVAGLNDPMDYDFVQPLGVVCPQQDFTVTTQRGIVTNCMDTVEVPALELLGHTLYKGCAYTGYHGNVYNSIAAAPAICRGDSLPTEASPLSVTISTRMTETVTSVSFPLAGMDKVAVECFKLAVLFYGYQKITEWCLGHIVRLLYKGSLGVSPVEPVDDTAHTPTDYVSEDEDSVGAEGHGQSRFTLEDVPVVIYGV